MLKKNSFLLNACSSLIITFGIGHTNGSYAADISFKYSGDKGPANWGQLVSKWDNCSDTSRTARQSPINIHHVKKDTKLKPLSLITHPTTIKITNNGHTIEQEYTGTNSNIYFEGTEYELKQFHFHTLSEHSINNERGALELHAVFSEPNSKNLVVSTLYEVGEKQNHFIQALIDAGLPKKKGDSTEVKSHINIADGITNTADYYTYAGSLTTPPCTGDVTWIILKEPAKISLQQLTFFRKILGNNFRPLQKINNRIVRSTIKSSNKRAIPN